MSHFDFLIIGAGIVGLSTARQLQIQFPNLRIGILEKQAFIGKHQSARNSGVVHAGIYYQPGSLKAEFCKQGLMDTKAFCQQYDLPYKQTGKLIVATNELELTRLKSLYKRCADNDVEVSWLEQEQLKKKEANIDGIAAIYSPLSAITDYSAICDQLAALFIEDGGVILCNNKVLKLTETESCISVSTSEALYSCNYLISCAGLQSDRIAKQLVDDLDLKIVPFRGEFYQLDNRFNSLVNHMIYPVPDPELPFLGVHITPRVDGSIILGPNAVQSWGRENYNRNLPVFRDLVDILLYTGFWKLIAKHWRSGLRELRDSVYQAGYMRRVQKYCPQLVIGDIKSFPTGIRAQAVSSKGELIHDFVFCRSKRSFHVVNAPSPAATSAFPIGRHIVEQVKASFDLKKG